MKPRETRGIRLTPIAQISQLKTHWHRKSLGWERERRRGGGRRERAWCWMAPYLVPKVINHSPAILPLGVFLHHNTADRRTVNITWREHHGRIPWPFSRENLENKVFHEEIRYYTGIFVEAWLTFWSWNFLSSTLVRLGRAFVYDINRAKLCVRPLFFFLSSWERCSRIHNLRTYCGFLVNNSYSDSVRTLWTKEDSKTNGRWLVVICFN